MKHVTLVLACGLALALPARLIGALFTSVTVSFNEYPFPVTTTDVTGATFSYNLLNDSTGALLGANNGDANDITLSFLNGPVGNLGSSRVEWQATSIGRYTGIRGFSGTVGSNNPGSRVSTVMQLEFGSHLTVTDLAATFLSLNTAGITWEFSVIGFLRPDGTFFTPQPTMSSYMSYPGFTGSPSEGWYVAASTGTVSGVGTNQTASGTTGPSDNLMLTYGVAGLPAGTQIGGIYFASFLEDVRGISNGTTSLTASFSQFSISGEIQQVPEPGTLLLTGAVVLALGLIRLQRSLPGNRWQSNVLRRAPRKQRLPC